MARSIQYWYDIIIGEKNTMTSLTALQPSIDSSQNFLNDLMSTSKVAVWRCIAWCVATCAYAIDVLFDLAKAEMQVIAQNANIGTPAWFAAKALDYQHGDTLQWNTNTSRFSYILPNPSAKIIARAAAQEAGDKLNVKVAKLNGTALQKLTAGEKSGFEAYMNKIRPALIVVNVISDDPDELRVFIKAYIDPLTTAANGELIAQPGVFPVEDAINGFITNLPFNGTLELSTLVDAVQTATGKPAYLSQALARAGANPFAPFTERYQPVAGWAKIDPTTPLNTSITYVQL